MAASTEIPPAGLFIIADWCGYQRTGKVISVLGGGALFCRFGYEPNETYELLVPDKNHHLRFYETEDALAAALRRERL